MLNIPLPPPIGLTAALEVAGYHVWLDSDANVITCRPTDETSVQAIVDAYSLTDAVNFVIPQIKELAGEIILAHVSDVKQRNLTAAAVSLTHAALSRALTPDEQALLSVYQQVWDWVVAVRTYSNQLEVNLHALTSFDAVAAYNWTSGWPEFPAGLVI
jgi:hypothetical protein